MKKIILISGGTGGHVNPAIAFGNALMKDGNKIMFITDLRGKKFFNETNNYKVLPIARLDWKFFLLLPYLFIKSLFLLKNAQEIVFFGGYICFAPFIAAKILRKKTIIFQLDSIITRLNAKLIPFADHLYYVFAQTKIPKVKSSSIINMPLRPGFEFEFIKWPKDIFKIAIVGGSLGSAYWEDLIQEALNLLPSEILKKIEIKIQTSQDLSFLNKYKLHKISSQPFYETCALFKESHLIISRAGACSIAEISAIARAAYICPWLGSMQNHQYFNAKNYCAFNGAIFGNNGAQLAKFIIKLINNKNYFIQTCEYAALSFPKGVV